MTSGCSELIFLVQLLRGDTSSLRVSGCVTVKSIKTVGWRVGAESWKLSCSQWRKHMRKLNVPCWSPQWFTIHTFTGRFLHQMFYLPDLSGLRWNLSGCSFCEHLEVPRLVQEHEESDWANHKRTSVKITVTWCPPSTCSVFIFSSLVQMSRSQLWTD